MKSNHKSLLMKISVIYKIKYLKKQNLFNSTKKYNRIDLIHINAI